MNGEAWEKTKSRAFSEGCQEHVQFSFGVDDFDCTVDHVNHTGEGYKMRTKVHTKIYHESQRTRVDLGVKIQKLNLPSSLVGP